MCPSIGANNQRALRARRLDMWNKAEKDEATAVAHMEAGTGK